jgi:hypothetical protein
MDKSTKDKFGRVWVSNAWMYTNNYFCIGCGQPIPRWYDEPHNRDKQICKHRRLSTGDVIQMEGVPAEGDFLSAEDYVEALAGTEVRSSFVSDGEADLVVGCYKTSPTTLELWCGGQKIATNATREQMAVLFHDAFQEMFGGATVEELVAEEFPTRQPLADTFSTI